MRTVCPSTVVCLIPSPDENRGFDQYPWAYRVRTELQSKYIKQIRKGSQTVSQSASMSGMEHPTKRFSHVISRVDNSSDIPHLNRASVLPILNGKMLDINMSSQERSIGMRALIILIAD